MAKLSLLLLLPLPTLGYQQAATLGKARFPVPYQDGGEAWMVGLPWLALFFLVRFPPRAGLLLNLSRNRAL